MKKPVFIIISIIVILVLGCLITAAGAFCPIYLESYQDVFNMHFGLPFAFFEQTTEIVFNGGYFPRYFAPQYFHEKFDTVLLPDMLALSLAVNIVIAAVIYVLIWYLHRIYRKKHPKKPRKKDEYIPVFD